MFDGDLDRLWLEKIRLTLTTVHPVLSELLIRVDGGASTGLTQASFTEMEKASGPSLCLWQTSLSPFSEAEGDAPKTVAKASAYWKLYL